MHYFGKPFRHAIGCGRYWHAPSDPPLSREPFMLVKRECRRADISLFHKLYAGWETRNIYRRGWIKEAPLKLKLASRAQGAPFPAKYRAGRDWLRGRLLLLPGRWERAWRAPRRLRSKGWTRRLLPLAARRVEGPHRERASAGDTPPSRTLRWGFTAGDVHQGGEQTQQKAASVR